jgi:hypothetical protein
MIIEQSKDQVDDATGFHTRAEIGSLRLTRARVWSRERITKATVQKVDFDIEFKSGASSSEEGSLFLETDFRFVINESQPDKPDEHLPLILIECCFEAEYRFKDYTPSEKQIEAFRSANAVFNCCPFFREYVQTSATRMNFPPPPVPFLRLVRKSETTEMPETPTPNTPHPI